jgi:hypothetical protein
MTTDQRRGIGLEQLSERRQKHLWALMAAIAVCLAAATMWLFSFSRRHPQAAVPAYRIVYTVAEGSAGRLDTCDLQGKNVTQLTDSSDFDGFVAVQPGRRSDGQQLLAYITLDGGLSRRSSEDEAAAGLSGSVHVSGVEGTSRQTVSEGLRIWPTAPSWSGDGSQLLFAAVQDLDSDGRAALEELGLYTYDASSLETKRVADINGAVLELRRSPSEALAIVTVERGPTILSELIDLETGAMLLDGPSPAACWSPDGSQLAAYLPDERRVYLLYPDGTEVLSFDGPAAGVVDLVWAPTWPLGSGSGAGTLIAIAAPFGQESMNAGQLYVRRITEDAAGWERVSGDQDYVLHMNASPDGRFLAYTLYRGSGNRPIPRADLMLLDLDSRQITPLTEGADFEGLADWLLPPPN